MNASKPPSGARTSYGSAGRDILSDIDYGNYLPDASPSVTEMIKNLVDQGVWKYTSVFLAQPFEVAKIVLQVQDANAIANSGMTKEKKSRRHASHGPGSSYNVRSGAFSYPFVLTLQISSDDSDDDSQSYFTSSAPLPASARQYRRRQASSPTPPGSPETSKQTDPSSVDHVHNLASPSSVTAALSTLWTHEGAWGVWKGTNSTFIHGILYSTITSFLRSLICALLGLPDSGSGTITFPGPSTLSPIDISISSSPFLSMVAAVAASGIAGLVLAPIDMARTKIILTPSTHPPRSIIPTLRSLKSWIVPSSIAPATILHSILPTFIATSTPIFLRSNMGIDPILTPTTYAAATFVSQTLELGMRLPVETALRRGQIAAVREDVAHTSAGARRPSAHQGFQTVVDVGQYNGLMGTMYRIIFEEGMREEKPGKAGAARTPTRKRKGQGLPGLFRGWRVGVWGLVGMWGAATLGGGKGDEF